MRYESIFRKNNVVMRIGILLLYNMVIAECEKVWINRNVTDSFRVGTEGCKHDSSICTKRSAECETDGLCLCDKDSPNFRNPVTEESGRYGKTYGCTGSEHIRNRVGTGMLPCQFKPFQVIPYSPKDLPTNFTAGKALPDCYLQTGIQGPQVKFPGNLNQESFDASYVNLTVSNKSVHFKWTRSVEHLQGTIITLKISCKITANKRENMCLVAKVLGSRSADITERSTSATTKPTSTPTTPELTTTMPTSETTADVISTDTMTTSSRPSTTSSLPGNYPCQLKPFQDIPYSPKDSPTKFTVESNSAKRLLGCYLISGAIGPGNATEMDIKWLKESYINVTVSNKDFYFQWKRSVPSLEGSIITIRFSCQITNNTREQMCLEAKVLGSKSPDITDRSISVTTRPSSTPTPKSSTTIATSSSTPDVHPTDTMKTSSTRSSPSDTRTQKSSLPPSQLLKTPTTLPQNPDTTITTSAAIFYTNPTDGMTTAQRSSARSSNPDTIKIGQSTSVTTKWSEESTTYGITFNSMITSPRLSTTSRPPREVPGNNSNFKWTLIAIAVVVPVVFVTVLIVVLCFLSKRIRKKNQRYLGPGSFELRTSSTSMQELRDIGGNVRGLDHNEDVLTENLLYSTSESRSAVVEVINPFYESHDGKNKNIDAFNTSSDHCYETPDVKKGQASCTTFKPGSKFENTMVATERSGGDGSLSGGLYEAIGGEINEINEGKSQSNTACFYKENGYVPSGSKKNGDANPESAYSEPDLKMETRDKKVDGANFYEDLDYDDFDCKNKAIDDRSSDTSDSKLDKKGYTSEVQRGGTVGPDPDNEPRYVKMGRIGGIKIDTKKKELDRQDPSVLDDGIKTVEETAGHSTPDTKRLEIVADLCIFPDENESSEDDDFNETGSSSRLIPGGGADDSESGGQLSQPTDSTDTVEEAVV